VEALLAAAAAAAAAKGLPPPARAEVDAVLQARSSPHAAASASTASLADARVTPCNRRRSRLQTASC
jgi:hypothetical protein